MSPLALKAAWQIRCFANNVTDKQRQCEINATAFVIDSETHLPELLAIATEVRRIASMKCGERIVADLFKLSDQIERLHFKDELK